LDLNLKVAEYTVVMDEPGEFNNVCFFRKHFCYFRTFLFFFLLYSQKRKVIFMFVCFDFHFFCFGINSSSILIHYFISDIISLLSLIDLYVPAKNGLCSSFDCNALSDNYPSPSCACNYATGCDIIRGASNFFFSFRFFLNFKFF